MKTKKMRFTARGLRNLKAIKSDIMAYAWKLAKIAAKKENCAPRDCLAWGLHTAWRIFRSLASRGGALRNKTKANHNEGYIIFGLDDCGTLADNFPHVFKRCFVSVRTSDNKVCALADDIERLKLITSSAWSVTVHNLNCYTFYAGNRIPLYLL